MLSLGAVQELAVGADIQPLEPKLKEPMQNERFVEWAWAFVVVEAGVVVLVCSVFVYYYQRWNYSDGFVART